MTDGRYRLKKSNRLLRRNEFDRVINKGKKFVSPSLIVFVRYRDANEGTESRLGIIVTKKNFKRAVDRNRIRRRLKEAFRYLLPEWARAMELVVIARHTIVDRSSDQIRSEIQKTLEKSEP